MQSSDNPAMLHSICHHKTPVRWCDGLPLGNGALGVMFWGDGAPFSLTLDHANLWDLRSDDTYLQAENYNYATLRKLVAAEQFAEVDEIFEQHHLRDNPVGPTKISIGRIELNLGQATKYHCELNIAQGIVCGLIENELNTNKIECFVASDMDVLCLHLEAPVEFEIIFKPLSEINTSLADLGHPLPVRSTHDELQVLSQQIPDGPTWAVTWNTQGSDRFITVAIAEDMQQAQVEAVNSWTKAAELGYEKIRINHLSAWNKFWSEAAVFIPEQNIEFLWYYGLYLLNSSSRKDAMPPGLQGVWPMDGVIPPWRGDYHADMNVQETFWPAYPSGKLELVDNWCNLMLRSIPRAKAFTRRFFGTEGTFWPCCTIPDFTIVPCWHTVQFAWSHSGWLASLVWLRWRYSMDCNWLHTTGYPIISEIFKFYRANLELEADGCLHVPLSSSPEYKENLPEAWCKDPAIDIALIRRCCDWTVELEKALGIDELSADAIRIKQQLVPYPISESGTLCLWPGKLLDASHRHPSHLMAIHPAMDLTVEGSDTEQALINASLEQYFALGQYLWAGHTYAQLASLGAVVGRGELAYDSLHKLLEYWLGPNGLHFNRDTRCTGVSAYQGNDAPFTLEANCGAVAGISDMLLQGWGDILRIFPAIPRHWKDVAFRELLAEGGWRVSAIMRDGVIQWVKITATVKRQLCLRDPFNGKGTQLSGPEINAVDDLLIADLLPGASIEISINGQQLDFDECAMLARQSISSRLGLR